MIDQQKTEDRLVCESSSTTGYGLLMIELIGIKHASVILVRRIGAWFPRLVAYRHLNKGPRLIA